MFAGKSVVITGAAAGIGRALTLRFAAAKADVWAADIDAAGLANLVDETTKLGQVIHTQQVDVCKDEQMTALRDAVIASKKQLDIWINNAGIAGLGDFLGQGAAAFDRVININLRAMTFGTRVALETMEDRGVGTIVNLASVAGHVPAPFMTAYCASKHGIVGFTRALRAELKTKNSPVRLLTVSPGFVDTAIIAKGEALGFPHWLSFLLSKPDDVADAIIRGIKHGDEEIVPTLNGKVMKGMYGVIPKMTVASSQLMLSPKLQGLFGKKAR